MSLIPKKSTPNFRNIQASFEQQQQHDSDNRNLQAIYPPHRSKAGDLVPSANVSSNQSRITSLSKSIDSVLDPSGAGNRSASPPNRPLAKFRPSWIGPQPSKKTKADVVRHLEPIMKQRVSIDFASTGLQPPVYIFTSLSHPQWEAIEMFPVKQMNGEFTFVRNFDVEEGEYQYKFRLGPGAWWVCDERKEVVDDGAGNRNNRVVVKNPDKKAPSGHGSPEKGLAANLQSKFVSQVEKAFAASSDVARSSGLVKGQEIYPAPDKGSSGQQTPEQERSDPMVEDQITKHDNIQPAHNHDLDDQGEPYTAPLLRHESLSPTSHEQDHSPLFRHESTGLGYNHHEDASPQPNANGSPAKPAFKTALAARLAPQEADPNDPSLHPFPTDHAGIVEHIHRTHTRLPADETGDDVLTSSPASSAAISDSSSVPALPVVSEEDDEQLEKIREAGEQEAQAEQELDPLREGEAAEAEDADFQVKVPELRALLVPKVEEVVVVERRASVVEKLGVRNLM